MSGKASTSSPSSPRTQDLFRAAVTGFASRADAQAFCAQLKAAKRACIVK